MWAFFVLAAVTALLQLGIPRISAAYGAAVQARFVERSKVIPGPGGDVPLDFASFSKWIADHPREARGYACPILFPLDLAFMFALAGALGFGSAWIGSAVSTFPWWVWWIVPLVYLAADVAEDIMLAVFLMYPARLTPSGFRTLASITSIKIKSVIIGFVVLAGLILLACIAMIW